jgi:RNA polymerase sigma-70 factor (ECF subfamily)
MKDDRGKGHQVNDGSHPRDPASHDRLDAEALFRAHAGFVAAFLQRLGTPAADIDDAVQDVFLVAHRKGGFVPGAAQPRTWLAAIAVHITQDGNRARRRRRELYDTSAIDAVVAGAPEPDRAIDARASLARVQQALNTLDLEHRAAFVLYEIEEEPCDAIAAAFEVPIGTVYSRLHHARRRFVDAYAALSENSAGVRPKLAEGA